MQPSQRFKEVSYHVFYLKFDSFSYSSSLASIRALLVGWQCKQDIKSLAKCMVYSVWSHNNFPVLTS